MVDSEWVTVTVAARRLGITRTAIYNRISRGTLKSQTDNHGHQLVNIADTVTPGTLRHVTRDTVTLTLNQEAPTEPRQTGQDGGDVVPAAIHREMIEALQTAHGAALVALQVQASRLQAEIERLQSDAAMERARADQQLVEERRRHESEIERLVGQVHAERSFWVERADAAEVRAEAAEERLHQAILHRTIQNRTWWRRWVG